MGMMEWSGSGGLKEIVGISGNRFTATWKSPVSPTVEGIIELQQIGWEDQRVDHVEQMVLV